MHWDTFWIMTRKGGPLGWARVMPGTPTLKCCICHWTCNLYWNENILYSFYHQYDGEAKIATMLCTIFASIFNLLIMFSAKERILLFSWMYHYTFLPFKAYIQYMKFARRAEGIKEARQIFKKAREDSRCKHHVFVAAALMEYYFSKVRIYDHF